VQAQVQAQVQQLLQWLQWLQLQLQPAGACWRLAQALALALAAAP
jgi:hypothetical protein